MSMSDNVYDWLLKLIVDEAQALISDDERITEDEDKFHDVLFGRVLTAVDDSPYSYLEAREISEVCSEVESDILHGDILGL
jgi:hypothetical protein